MLCSTIMIHDDIIICLNRSGIFRLSLEANGCSVARYSRELRIPYISIATACNGLSLIIIGRYAFSMAALNDCMRPNKPVSVVFFSPASAFLCNLGRSVQIMRYSSKHSARMRVIVISVNFLLSCVTLSPRCAARSSSSSSIFKGKRVSYSSRRI